MVAFANIERYTAVSIGCPTLPLPYKRKELIYKSSFKVGEV